MKIGQLATGRSSIGRRPIGEMRNIIPSTSSSSRADLRRDERISGGGIDEVIHATKRQAVAKSGNAMRVHSALKQSTVEIGLNLLTIIPARLVADNLNFFSVPERLPS
jgi:hypothetical protein